MRVLPGAVRPPISLAYLLARACDTVADTQLVALQSRLGALRQLRDRITGASTTALDLGPLAKCQGLPAEKQLLERCEEALGRLEALAMFDKDEVRSVLATIISGQELDLSRFGGLRPGQLEALETDAELDDYTYRVAGCVGGFWTRLCRVHLFAGADVDDRFLLETSTRFGKGLQLVNILRDIPRDLRKGRCYLPRSALAAAGLKAADLLSMTNQQALRSTYDGYLARAEAHLRAGWDYTNALPAGQLRLRLACAWPLLIGVKTLAKLRGADFLDPEKTVKITRKEVRTVMARTVLLYPCQPAWRAQFATLQHKEGS